MSVRSTLRVLIADADTLRAAGLRYFIREYFGVDARICGAAVDSSDFDIVFATPEALVASTDVLMPRAASVVIVGSVASGSCGHFRRIDPQAEPEMLIEAVGSALGAADSNAHDDPRLSQRETEVLQLVATGLSNKEIASRLNISLNTVLTHCKNISSKLGIRSRSGLTVYALMRGVVPSNEL